MAQREAEWHQEILETKCPTPVDGRVYAYIGILLDRYVYIYIHTCHES